MGAPSSLLHHSKSFVTRSDSIFFLPGLNPDSEFSETCHDVIRHEAVEDHLQYRCKDPPTSFSAKSHDLLEGDVQTAVGA